jgi:hypothetical protein
MPNFKFAFIVKGHPEPLQGLDTLKIDNEEDVAALRDAIVGRENYSGRRADVKLWKVCSLNHIRARSSTSDFPRSSTTRQMWNQRALTILFAASTTNFPPLPSP